MTKNAKALGFYDGAGPGSVPGLVGVSPEEERANAENNLKGHVAVRGRRFKVGADADLHDVLRRAGYEKSE